MTNKEKVLKAIWRHIEYIDGFHDISQYSPDIINLHISSDKDPEDFKIIKEWIMK